MEETSPPPTANAWGAWALLPPAPLPLWGGLLLVKKRLLDMLPTGSARLNERTFGKAGSAPWNVSEYKSISVLP